MVENNNILRLGACSKVYVRPGGARAGDSDGVCEVVVCVRGVYVRAPISIPGEVNPKETC